MSLGYEPASEPLHISLYHDETNTTPTGLDAPRVASSAPQEPLIRVAVFWFLLRVGRSPHRALRLFFHLLGGWIKCTMPELIVPFTNVQTTSQWCGPRQTPGRGRTQSQPPVQASNFQKSTPLHMTSPKRFPPAVWRGCAAVERYRLAAFLK